MQVCAVCGVPVCAECRRGTRRTSLCSDHEHVRLVSGWAEAARASDEMEAELIAGRLRSADVDVQIFSQKDHVNVVGLGGLAIVRVLVPVFQLEAATRVLAEHDSGRSGTG